MHDVSYLADSIFTDITFREGFSEEKIRGTMEASY